MPRTSLLLAAFLAFAAGPAVAQDPMTQEHTWTADRPDGVAPGGVFADRVLGEGEFEVTALYSNMDLSGVRFGTDFLSIDETLDFFEVAPLTLTTEVLEVRLGMGLGDGLSLLARTGFASKRREQVTDETFFVLESEALTDTEVHVLWEVFGEGAVRAHFQGGVVLPTGSVEEEADLAGIRTGVLPYDMQTGVGTVGVLPGFTVQMQNEVGTVGAQVTGRVYFGENDRGWRPGNAVEANGWASYRFNDYFAATAAVRAIGWGAIEEADDALDPFRDPGELASSFGGSRVDLPIGLNLYLPDGTLAGHRLSVQWVSNVHEDLDGPWLAADHGFTIAWQATFQN
ncbi:MAG TPA: hypothetical protein VLL48_08710 [Longimicrobiales bacterium]|nr:hypothetical protein [Longimicrobiales bacterium]